MPGQCEGGAVSFDDSLLVRRIRQFHRQSDGGDHAIGSRDILPSDHEGRSMIGAGSGKREPESHIHALMKGVEFERDQTLVVIHAKNRVEFSCDRPMENGIGRVGAGEDCGWLMVEC